MKEVFLALANYKAKVDDTLLKILEGLGEDKLMAPTGAYYPTILAELKHLLASDANWFKRLKGALPGNAVLEASRFADYDQEALKALSFPERSRIFADLRELDREVVALVAGLSESSFTQTVSYPFRQGKTDTRELWQALMQWSNHGTHHRGGISGHLDAMGVENDYSSFLATL